MKGFLSVLAVPALILPALANPVPALSMGHAEKEATAILSKLNTMVAPQDAKIEQEVASLNGKAPSAAQLSSMQSGMGAVIKEIVDAVGELTTVVTAIDKREETSDQTALKNELTTVVTGITKMVAAVHDAPKVNAEMGSYETKAIDEMKAMGNPLGALVPLAGEVINQIILEGVNFAPSKQ